MELLTLFRTTIFAVLLGAPLAMGAVPKHLTQEITEAARRSSLDPNLVAAVVKVESNFNHKATSPRGAKGLMQVIDATASENQIHDPYHVVNNLMGACEYLRKLINRYRGNLKLALAAYNAGPGKVDKFKGIPPIKETQKYVEKVLSLYREYTVQN